MGLRKCCVAFLQRSRKQKRDKIVQTNKVIAEETAEADQYVAELLAKFKREALKFTSGVLNERVESRRESGSGAEGDEEAASASRETGRDKGGVARGATVDEWGSEEDAPELDQKESWRAQRPSSPEGRAPGEIAQGARDMAIGGDLGKGRRAGQEEGLPGAESVERQAGEER